MKTEHFKKRLEEEKARLESEMQTVGRRNLAVPNDWESLPEETNTASDLVDQADIVVNRENNAAVLSDLEVRYDTILAMLENIEKGTYGKCDVCGADITEERLEANPAAATCALHMR